MNERQNVAEHLLETHGALMLALAKAAILRELGGGTSEPPEPPGALSEPGASFVTLKLDGQLRGCIGSVEPWRPLAQDIEDNARRAAFKDPRFPPLSAHEVDEALSLSIAVLSPKSPIEATDEAALLAALVPGTDGVIIEDGARRALFLPAVWEQLPEPESFIRHLKAKAGLSPDHWSGAFGSWRFASVYVKSAWNDIGA